MAAPANQRRRRQADREGSPKLEGRDQRERCQWPFESPVVSQEILHNVRSLRRSRHGAGNGASKALL